MPRYTRHEDLSRNDMIALARQLRRDMTKTERYFWKHIRGGRCNGHEFRRQHPLGPYILDFYCPGARLVIELDGDTHDPEKDRVRDKFINDYGIKVLRFRNREVFGNTMLVMDIVWREVNARVNDKTENGNDSPPGPLP